MDIHSWTKSSVWWPALVILALTFQPATLTALPIESPLETATTNSVTPSPKQIIEEGIDLEEQGHWGEALSLYQRAIKKFPKNNQLIEKRTVARIHYDLQRRYSDNSFRLTLSGSSPSKSLNVYSEVLLKVQSYYVDQPDWARLASFGLHSLEVALRCEEFCDVNIPNQSADQIRSAITSVRQSLNGQTVGSRHDVYRIASAVAKQMQSSIGLPIQSTIFEFTNGAIAALDPYSSYMSDSQYSEAMSQIEGNFVGLGVELRTHDDHLEIVSVIEGGPAYDGKIVKGDQIIAVDGHQVITIGSEKAADMLRGVEGSLVSIAIKRNPTDTEVIRLQRRRVEIPSVEDVKIVDANEKIGYIRLTNFQKKTVRDFDQALWNLHSQGMQSLIVDVRGNPGGLLSASVDVANRFVSSGIIVSTRGRNPIEDFTHRAEVNNTWRVPLVVLIDENSASASEIFAAAIADHRRGTIVGNQSFGKGSVQGIFPLNVSGGGVRLTTAKFYSPQGKAISEVGVKPDVNVRLSAKVDLQAKALPAKDPTLRIGMQVASRAVAMRVQQRERGVIAGR